MIGRMKNKVDVQYLSSVEDGFGTGAGDVWTKKRAEWFLIEPLSAREFNQADQMQSQATHNGRCHYFDGANSGMRLVYGSRIFHVESVFNDREDNRFLAWKLIEAVD